MSDITAVLLTVLYSVSLILLALFFVSRNLSWFIRNRIRILSTVIIAGLIIYAIGYISAADQDSGAIKYISSGFMAIFSMGRMFVMENDLGELGAVATTPLYRGIFGLIMVIAMLTVVMVALTLFGYRFICSIRVSFLRIFGSRKDGFIFSELNETSLALAEDIRATRKKSLILFLVAESMLDPDEKSLEKHAAAANYILLPSSEDKAKLSNFGLFPRMSGKIHFLVMEDKGEQCARLALTLAKITTGSALRPRLTLHVFADSMYYSDLFEDKVFDNLEVVLTDLDEIRARHLMSKLSLISCVRGKQETDGELKGTLTVAVIGYTSVTPHLYRFIATQGQFYGLSLRIIAIDTDIHNKAASFLHGNPQLEQCVRFETEDRTPGSQAFYTYIDKTLHEIDCVVCAFDEDKSAIRIATDLKKVASIGKQKNTVCLALRCEENAPLLFSSELLKDILVFGGDRSIYKADVIIDEKLDLMAKAVHNYYRVCYSDPHAWRDLSPYEKGSSRALAYHIPDKLRSVGLAISGEGDTGLYDRLITARPDVLENLTRGEHLRWNAHLFTHGWRTMPFDGTYIGKDTARKEHQCLTEWDALPKMTAAAGKDFQQIDRHLVRHIGNMVRDAGLGVCKIEEDKKI